MALGSGLGTRGWDEGKQGFLLNLVMNMGRIKTWGEVFYPGQSASAISRLAVETQGHSLSVVGLSGGFRSCQGQ